MTQEGATDDDGVPEVGALLPGLEQRGAPEAHSGTEPGSQPGLWKGGTLQPHNSKQTLASAANTNYAGTNVQPTTCSVSEN